MTAKSVLIAEDEQHDAFLLRLAFRKSGLPHRVVHVWDGEETIGYLRQAKTAARGGPDLLLLDLKMPRVSGFEVLMWLQAQQGPRIMPVVVFSSSNLASDIKRATLLGAHEYLVKPDDWDQWMPLVQMLHGRWLSAV